MTNTIMLAELNTGDVVTMKPDGTDLLGFTLLEPHVYVTEIVPGEPIMVSRQELRAFAQKHFDSL